MEAALVTPIFLMFLMAIAEAGLYMRNDLGVANTVRAGSRAASAAGSDLTADLFTVHQLAKESTAIPRSAIKYVVVYKATGFGAGPVAEESAGVPGNCISGIAVAGQCNVYTTADFTKAAVEMKERSRHSTALQTNPNDVLDESKISFTCKPTSPDRFWCPRNRVDAFSGNGGLGPDYVGVYMKIDHKWLTKIFGTARDITDQSVIKIEPRRK